MARDGGRVRAAGTVIGDDRRGAAHSSLICGSRAVRMQQERRVSACIASIQPWCGELEKSQADPRRNDRGFKFTAADGARVSWLVSSRMPAGDAVVDPAILLDQVDAETHRLRAPLARCFLGLVGIACGRQRTAAEADRAGKDQGYKEGGCGSHFDSPLKGNRIGCDNATAL